MKFECPSATDTDLCLAIEHEFFRCDDAFNMFRATPGVLVMQGQSKQRSYAAYNAYSYFILHMYQFMVGCMVREAQDTDADQGKGATARCEAFLQWHADRILRNTRKAILNGTAPSWENDISAYPDMVPPDFAKDLRRFRNRTTGHVSHRRATMDLSEFYANYHLFMVLLWRDAGDMWGRREGEFPMMKEITNFNTALGFERIAAAQAARVGATVPPEVK